MFLIHKSNFCKLYCYCFWWKGVDYKLEVTNVLLNLGNCGKVIQVSLPQHVTRFGIVEWLLYVTCARSNFQQCKSILSSKGHSQLLYWKETLNKKFVFLSNNHIFDTWKVLKFARKKFSISNLPNTMQELIGDD